MKICPLTKDKVLYLDCLDCDDRRDCGKDTDDKNTTGDENEKLLSDLGVTIIEKEADKGLE